MQRLIKTPNTIEQSEINKAKRLLDINPVMLYHGNQDAREQFLIIRREDRLKNLQKEQIVAIKGKSICRMIREDWQIC